MVEWRITNSVFTVAFNIVLPLSKIAEELQNLRDISIDYNPSRFSGLILYTNFTKENKKIKIIIFSSGLMNITGLKNIEKLISIIEKIREIFKRIGIDLPEAYELKVTNIVISGKFDYDNIDLDKISSDFDNRNSRFPGIPIPYYISEDYKVTFNIFRNGRFVCTGIKSDINNIEQTINNIVNSFQEKVIKKYAKQ